MQKFICCVLVVHLYIILLRFSLKYLKTDVTKEDAGIYTCVANSLRGKTTSTALVKVQDKTFKFKRIDNSKLIPEAPPTPLIVSSNGTTAVLKWFPDKNTPITVESYVIEYFTPGGPWVTVPNSPRIPLFTLTNLNPQRSYGVILRARNKYGVSEPSGVAEIGGDGAEPWKHSLKQSQLEEASVVLHAVKINSPSSGSVKASFSWQVCNCRKIICLSLSDI